MRDVVEHWYGRRPQVFDNHDLDLAVAVGAAYYSYVRSTGSGVLVRGGLPRAYYLGLQDDKPEAFRAVCLVPRGAEEGRKSGLTKPIFSLWRTSSSLFGFIVRFSARKISPGSCRAS